MSDEFSEIATNASSEIGKEMDAHILRFFGSEENFRKNAHLWVLEVIPAKVVMGEGAFEGITFQMETKYRLRPKTPKELEDDA